MQAPPREAEEPGKDKITVPVTKPPKLEAPKQATKEPDPIEQLNIPAKNLAAATESLPGAIEAPPAPTLSQGAGSGGGAGTRLACKPLKTNRIGEEEDLKQRFAIIRSRPLANR
jgi:hypothetical protein